MDLLRYFQHAALTTLRKDISRCWGIPPTSGKPPSAAHWMNSIDAPPPGGFSQYTLRGILKITAIFVWLGVLLLEAGCAKQPLTAVERADLDRRAIVEISEALQQLPLSPKLKIVPQNTVTKEAKLIASRLVNQTRETNKEFRMTTTPNWHNFLIHLGKRKKGYCYHWVQELLKALPGEPLQAFERHWGVAYKTLDENNAVIITRRGAPLETGIVYDAWRGSGRPWWKHVKEDKKYKWRQRFHEGQILRGEGVVVPK